MEETLFTTLLYELFSHNFLLLYSSNISVTKYFLLLQLASLQSMANKSNQILHFTDNLDLFKFYQ